MKNFFKKHYNSILVLAIGIVIFPFYGVYRILVLFLMIFILCCYIKLKFKSLNQNLLDLKELKARFFIALYFGFNFMLIFSMFYPILNLLNFLLNFDLEPSTIVSIMDIKLNEIKDRVISVSNSIEEQKGISTDFCFTSLEVVSLCIRSFLNSLFFLLLGKFMMHCDSTDECIQAKQTERIKGQDKGTFDLSDPNLPLIFNRRLDLNLITQRLKLRLIPKDVADREHNVLFVPKSKVGAGGVRDIMYVKEVREQISSQQNYVVFPGKDGYIIISGREMWATLDKLREDKQACYKQGWKSLESFSLKENFGNNGYLQGSFRLKILRDKKEDQVNQEFIPEQGDIKEIFSTRIEERELLINIASRATQWTDKPYKFKAIFLTNEKLNEVGRLNYKELEEVQPQTLKSCNWVEMKGKDGQIMLSSVKTSTRIHSIRLKGLEYNPNQYKNNWDYTTNQLRYLDYNNRMGQLFDPTNQRFITQDEKWTDNCKDLMTNFYTDFIKEGADPIATYNYINGQLYNGLRQLSYMSNSNGHPTVLDTGQTPEANQTYSQILEDLTFQRQSILSRNLTHPEFKNDESPETQVLRSFVNYPINFSSIPTSNNNLINAANNFALNRSQSVGDDQNNTTTNPVTETNLAEAANSYTNQ